MLKSARFCQLLLCLCLLSLAEFNAVIALAQSPHNVILFIPDGLRPESVNPTIAPTFARVRDQGVRFANSHSIFPTLTMVNSAAMGTSHFPGDMGNYANTVYAGFPVPSANGSVTPMIENDAILGEINARFSGNYLNEETLLAAARKVRLLTASVGKVGPGAVYDVTERSGEETIIIDDLTGRPGGLPLSAKTLEALQMASLPNAAPARDDNARVGDGKHPEPMWLTLSNKPTSPTSRRRQYCRCLKPQESRSCWCFGRATRTARNTIRAIVWGNSCLASTVPLHKHRSKTPTI